jgi:hypothetical protein
MFRLLSLWSPDELVSQHYDNLPTKEQVRTKLAHTSTTINLTHAQPSHIVIYSLKVLAGSPRQDFHIVVAPLALFGNSSLIFNLMLS